jgi:hypothetical protein
MRLGTRGLWAAVAALALAAGCEKREVPQRETVSAPEQTEPGTTSQSRTPPPAPAPAPRPGPEPEQPPRAEAPRPTEPQARKPDEAETTREARAQQVTGEVLSFTQNELYVLSGSNDVRMLVIPGTEVRVNGRPATAADIREGSEVRATFEISEGQPVALLVEVQRGPEGVSPPAGGEAQQPEPQFERPRIPKSED